MGMDRRCAAQNIERLYWQEHKTLRALGGVQDKKPGERKM